MVPNGFKHCPHEGYIPLDWEVKSAEDVCTKVTDGTHDTPKATLSGVPYITAIHVKNGKIDFANSLFLPEDIHSNIYRRCNPQKGDLLVVNIGAGVADCGFVNVDFEFSLKNVALLKPDRKQLVPEYLFQHHSFKQGRIAHQVKSGGAQPFLSLKDLRKLKIVTPPLPEQSKIAQILSTWDRGIATTEKLIEASKQQKKALMQQLLTGKKRLVDPETGKAFEGEWEEVKLSKLFARATEKNKGQSTNVVTISAQHGLIRQEEFFKKSIASETLDNYFILRKGQFAYNKSYSNGYPMGAIKRLNRYDDAVVTSLYICFEIKNSAHTSSCFMEQYFESGLLNRGLTKVAAEGGRAHGLLNVKPTDFMGLALVVPEINEQQKIASVLTAADKEIELLVAKLTHLKQEKKALMQQLLTGKRRVSLSS